MCSSKTKDVQKGKRWNFQKATWIGGEFLECQGVAWKRTTPRFQPSKWGGAMYILVSEKRIKKRADAGASFQGEKNRVTAPARKR